MLIHVGLATESPKSPVRRDEIVALHASCRTQRHELTDDPEAADLIVLAGHLETLAEARANPLIRRYPEKTFGNSEIDFLIPYIPGAYGDAAKPRFFDLRRIQSTTFFSMYGSSRNPELRYRGDEPKTLLCCFHGRKNARIRVNLIDHPFNRPDVEVLETTGYMHWQNGIVGSTGAQKAFADAMARSHFALCPRGMGFGSLRLFEAMMMGVAPVLLADRYLLPPGPDWGSFLLQYPESDYARLPALLEPHVAESAERGRRARQAWEQHFAPEVVFDLFIDQLCEIRRRRRIPERLYRLFWPLIQLQVDAKQKAATLLGRRLKVQY